MSEFVDNLWTGSNIVVLPTSRHEILNKDGELIDLRELSLKEIKELIDKNIKEWRVNADTRNKLQDRHKMLYGEK